MKFIDEVSFQKKHNLFKLLNDIPYAEQVESESDSGQMQASRQKQKIEKSSYEKSQEKSFIQSTPREYDQS